MSRASYALTKAKPESTFCCLMALICCFLVMLLPPYDRMMYKRTEAVNEDDLEMTGYPAGDDIPVVHSVEEIHSKNWCFTIEVDVEDLEPLKLYKSFGESEMTTSAIDHWSSALMNSKLMGRFYVVHFENGERIAVLIDDRAFKIPDEGTVRLPIGNMYGPSASTMTKLHSNSDLSYDELKIFVDMGSDWRLNSKEAGKVTLFRWSFGMGTLAGSWIMLFFLVRVLSKPKPGN